MALSFEDMCNPARCSLADAQDAARSMSGSTKNFDARVSQALSMAWTTHEVDLAAVGRLLELLVVIVPASRLFPTIRAALSHSDPHVRSKAALLVGQKLDSAGLLSRLARDEDPRVRANTLQALWGRNQDAVKVLFVDALEDSHHRVAANAAFGLMGIDPEGHRERLERFIHHANPRFRQAGAWLLRKAGDPGNLNLLQTLVTDKDAGVRTSAFAALVALRRATVPEEIPAE